MNWEYIASSALNGFDMQAAALDGLIYVAGYNPIDVYDPSTDSWSTIDYDDTSIIAPQGIGCCSQAGDIWIAGGRLADNSAYSGRFDRYNPGTGLWTTGSLPVTDENCRLAPWGTDFIYKLGGANDFDVLRRYQISTATWTVQSPLPTWAGLPHTIAWDADYLYLFEVGLSSFTITDTDRWWRYTFATDTWTLMGALPRPGLQGGAWAAANGNLYWGLGVSGLDSSPRTARSDVYEWDGTTWSFLNDTNVGRKGPASGRLDSTLYAFHGTVGGTGDGPISTNERLVLAPPVIGQWAWRGLA